MSEMKWQSLSVDALRPAAYNPRKKLKAGDKEYEKIKTSIQEFGYVEPIIVNYDMTVIGGHQRLTVLKDVPMRCARSSWLRRRMRRAAEIFWPRRRSARATGRGMATCAPERFFSEEDIPYNLKYDLIIYIIVHI